MATYLATPIGAQNGCSCTVMSPLVVVQWTFVSGISHVLNEPVWRLINNKSRRAGEQESGGGGEGV
jgi:hypothetical protein